MEFHTRYWIQKGCLVLRQIQWVLVALAISCFWSQPASAEGPQSKEEKVEAPTKEPIGDYLLRSGLLDSKGADPLQRLRMPNGCPEPKYCRLSKKQMTAFLRGLNQVGRDQGDFVAQQMMKFGIRKPSYERTLRKALGIKDPDSELTSQQYVDALGVSIESGGVKLSELMDDLKHNASDLYEALDAAYDGNTKN